MSWDLPALPRTAVTLRPLSLRLLALWLSLRLSLPVAGLRLSLGLLWLSLRRSPTLGRLSPIALSLRLSLRLSLGLSPTLGRACLSPVSAAGLRVAALSPGAHNLRRCPTKGRANFFHV